MYVPKIKPVLTFGSISSFTINQAVCIYTIYFSENVENLRGCVCSVLFLAQYKSKSDSCQLRDSSVLMVTVTVTVLTQSFRAAVLQQILNFKGAIPIFFHSPNFFRLDMKDSSPFRFRL